MKWFRKIKFKKRWIENPSEGENNYRIITDAALTAFILDKTNYYQLKICKIDLGDSYTCSIKLFGDKDLYLKFVADFIKQFKTHLTSLSF